MPESLFLANNSTVHLPLLRHQVELHQLPVFAVQQVHEAAPNGTRIAGEGAGSGEFG